MEEASLFRKVESPCGRSHFVRSPISFCNWDDGIRRIYFMAPFLPDISNQFYEDLRKIAELKPLMEDIDLSKVEVDEEPEQWDPGRFLHYKRH